MAIIPALLAFLWIATPAAASEQTVTLSEPTYILEMTTGVTSGTEDQIDFFIVNYTVEGDSEVNSAFVFKSDAITKKSEIIAEERSVERSYGRSSPQNEELFRRYATDQYLFTTPREIGTVDSIQIFCEARPTENTDSDGVQTAPITFEQLTAYLASRTV